MSERRLRTKDERTRLNKVYDFDGANPWIFRNKPIKVTSGTTVNKPYRYGSEGILPAKKTTNTRDVTLPPLVLAYDPLADGAYEKFHRKGLNFERVRYNEDLGRMNQSYEMVRDQMELLEHDDWGRTIHEIVFIDDRADANEVKYRRLLAHREVLRLLGMFNDWKRRCDKLAVDIRQNEGWPGSVCDKGENNMSLEEIRLRRTIQWKQEFGGGYRLVLNNRLFVVVDPVVPPVVINLRGSVIGPKRRRFSDYSWEKGVVAKRPLRASRKKKSIKEVEIVKEEKQYGEVWLAEALADGINGSIRPFADAPFGLDISPAASGFTLPPEIKRWKNTEMENN